MSERRENPLIGKNGLDMPLDDLYQHFITDRRARQLSQKSIDFYLYHLDLLRNYAASQGWATVQDLTADNLRGFLDVFGQSHGRGGVHALFRTLRALCNWFESEDETAAWRNPVRRIHAPKTKTDPIPGVTQDDVKRLAAVCGGGWYGHRDRALFLFLFDTGLRISECCALNLQHIDVTTGTVQVLNGKGMKDRIVYFSDETAGELRRYMRGRASDPPDSPLWFNRFGERLNPVCFRDILRRRAQDAGIENIPSAHDFRRGFALHMLRNGADVLTVARLLGHGNLDVAQRYLALVQDDLERVHRAASPVAGMQKKGGRVRPARY